jgi:hypothetical protein
MHAAQWCVLAVKFYQEHQNICSSTAPPFYVKISSSNDWCAVPTILALVLTASEKRSCLLRLVGHNPAKCKHHAGMVIQLQLLRRRI